MKDNYTREELDIISQAEANGTYLKASNGTETNLSPEQWVQVRTSAFKEWFGDWLNNPDAASKILDPNGEPVVMFHGSRSTFTEFSKEKGGASNKMGKIGFWFTPMEAFARNFAEESWWGDGEHVTNYNTFLSLKNPKVYERRDIDDEKKPIEEALLSIRCEIKELKGKWTGINWYASEAFGIAARNGFPDAAAREYYGARTPDSMQAIRDGERVLELSGKEQKLSDRLYELLYNDPYEQLRTDLYRFGGMNAYDANIGGTGMALDNEEEVLEQFKESLMAQGFDGIIVRGTRYDIRLAGGVENDQYVAFYPNQIKSAIENVGSFSLDNDDIRYRLIGEKGAAGLEREEERILIEGSFSGSMYSPKAELVSVIDSLSNSLHVPIDIIKDIDELPDGTLKRKLESGQKIKGWFVPTTNSVAVYLPNISSPDDAFRTVMHESVAHLGLRKMFGEHFDTFLDNIYNNATAEIQGRIMYATHGDPAKRLVATEEYLARLAEKGFHNRQEISLWERAKFAFIDMLRYSGVKLGFKLHDDDLRGILYKSYQKQIRNDFDNSSKIKLVVYKEHTLGYILPELPNSVQILQSSPLKGAIGTTNLQGNYHINNLSEIRLAGEKDFDDFNVDFKGYDNKEVYEYNEVVNADKELKSSFLDNDFKAAVEGEDYKRLSQLKEGGYVPTEEFLNSFSNNISTNSLVTVQKIFGLSPTASPHLETAVSQDRECERERARPSMPENIISI